uniref:Ras-related protein Rab-18-like n=1 Tax=Dermatophagoides pteronyssinus TaxID=6956 RepID=A0A6P6YKY0_DERPT|nr:ras-related protein Rab-18-like [Dermatophagoides pteronyssinus]
MNTDNVWKVLIVGNSGVGKSSVLMRFVSNDFKEDVLATIGVDFKMKVLKIGDETHKLALWDTAGQERFRGLASSYYKGAHACIVMYDVADRASFDATLYWIKEVKDNCMTDPLFCIVGNKIDRRTPENQALCISAEEGRNLAMKHRCLFLETSALSNEGIQTLFNQLPGKLSEIFSKERLRPRPGVKLSDQQQKPHSLCPC